jgi:hypothetical protein
MFFVSFGILSVLQVIEENDDFYVELQRREKLKYIENVEFGKCGFPNKAMLLGKAK